MMVDLQALEAFSDADLKNWLFSFLSHNWDEETVADIDPRIHPSVYVQKFHNQANFSLKDRLGRAISAGLGEWRLRAHGWDLLNNLAYAAALIRARYAFANLANAIDRTGLIYTHRQAPFKCADLLVGVLAGFAPSDDVKLILESYFYDPKLDPRLAGQLFHGLCISDRGQFPSYFRRYRELADQVPGYFAEEFMTQSLLEVIKPPILASLWSALSSQDQTYLLSMLSTQSHPEIALDITEEGPTLFWHGPQGTTAFTLVAEHSLPASDYANVYKEQTKNFTVHGFLMSLYQS